MVLEVYDVMDPMGRSLFVLNDTDTIEGPRAPAVMPERVTQADEDEGV